jgi:surfeit locus 1 family protein
MFSPLCDPATRICYARDVSHVAGLAGAGSVAEFFVDLGTDHTDPSGLPQAGETRIRFTNNHLQYALTWFGLAAALIGVAGAFWWSRRKRTSGVSGLSR